MKPNPKRAPQRRRTRTSPLSGLFFRPRSVEEAISALGSPTAPGSWQFIDAAGTLVVTPDGRPIRSAITGRRVIVSGSYASRKSRRTQPHESMNELALFHESEVDVDVVDYRAQPFRFEFELDGRKATYIADCFRVLSGAPPEVVEVKSDYRHLRDPAYAEKLRRVGEICALLGWRFRTVTKADLLEPRLRRANIQLVQSKRLVRFSAPDVYAATEILQHATQPVSMGVLSEALGDARSGMARLMAMMVARVVKIDLAKPISPTSLVSLVAAPSSQTVEVR